MSESSKTQQPRAMMWVLQTVNDTGDQLPLVEWKNALQMFSCVQTDPSCPNIEVAGEIKGKAAEPIPRPFMLTIRKEIEGKWHTLITGRIKKPTREVRHLKPERGRQRPSQTSRLTSKKWSPPRRRRGSETWSNVKRCLPARLCQQFDQSGSLPDQPRV